MAVPLPEGLYCELIAVNRMVDPETLATLHDVPVDDLAALGARNCYSPRSPRELRTAMADREKDSAIRTTVASKHWTVAGHLSFTFAYSCSIAALKQITRRRTGVVFSVKSGRYVKGRHFQSFVVPPSIQAHPEALEAYVRHMEEGFRLAERMEKEWGIPSEDARYLTGEGKLTHVVMTVNGEALIDWATKRECYGAQWEVRALMVEWLRAARKVAPKVFYRVGAPCVMTGICTEMRSRYEVCPRRHVFPHQDDLARSWQEQRRARRVNPTAVLEAEN
jgi:thymidylate synthase (FAD)